MPSIYDFTVRDIAGHDYPLAQHVGKVLLIVNTASACGFTPQLTGLQDLYQQYATRGLVVIGFPCNQFGGQDPASNQEIGAFCQRNYGVDFPMMEKVEVRGSNATPLFQWLCDEAPGLLGSKPIKWNFTKFLVGRNGQVRQRFAPQTKPQALRQAIEVSLAAVG